MDTCIWRMICAYLGALTSVFTKLGSLLVLPPQHPVVRNALFCLESAWKSAKERPHGKHVYTKALLAYAFALAGNQDKRRETLDLLHGEAVKEGERTSEISHPPFSVSRTVLQTPHTPTSYDPSPLSSFVYITRKSGISSASHTSKDKRQCTVAVRSWASGD